jgi:hypothetical protein
MVGMDVSNRHSREYPGLSRDTGAEILNLIQKGTVRELYDDTSFAGDSLFCEYAYVLDLDNKVLEIYKGFNKTVPKGRFAKILNPDRSGGYGPVTLLKKIKFADCGVKALKQLAKEQQAEA